MDLGLYSLEIKTLYEEFRQPLINWLMNKYQIDIDLATDIYQDSIIIFIENIYIEKKATIQANSNKKTYLYSIAKNRTREHFRRKNKTSELTDNHRDLLSEEPSDQSKGNTERVDQAIRAYESLGDRCQQVLMMAVVSKASMQEIAEELQYENRNTAKNMKFKCLQRLRKRFSQLNQIPNG